jgi:predicted ABC-class ATPase
VHVARVQSDPFAPASRVHVRIPAEVAGLPPDLYGNDTRARGLAGCLARQVRTALGGGAAHIDAGGQEVLERSSLRVEPDGSVEWRIGVELPGRGRRIDGHAAARVLCDTLPDAVDATRHEALDAERVRHFVDTVEDTTHLRSLLPELGLVSFVVDGAVLPRRSGVDDRSMGEQAVPFAAPDSLAVTVELPHRGTVHGMGIGTGVTLIVGGGFHGKSTLLRALERGVYDHVPGDGRELVAAIPEGVKVRAEDGRSVTRTDVSAFVDHLPSGGDTADFTTENASGSTSQAASLSEAVEVGARGLLIDEDTAATNLMIRDARMQALVAKDREPLTPFVDLVRSLHRDRGVSTVLVMGGSGDYMDVADRVIMMDSYRPLDVTDRAAALAATPTGRSPEAGTFPLTRARQPDPASLSPQVRGKRKLRARGTDTLSYGSSDIELRAVEQITDPAQVTGIGLALTALAGHLGDGRSLAGALAEWEVEIRRGGVRALITGFDGDAAVPRRFEVAAALNRLRALRVQALRPAKE